MAGRGTAQRAAEKAAARPLGVSELRLRVGGVEIAVVGESREDCLRQLDAAAVEVDAATRLAETRYALTEAGRRALGQVA
jgi:ribosomal protein S11